MLNSPADAHELTFSCYNKQAFPSDDRVGLKQSETIPGAREIHNFDTHRAIGSPAAYIHGKPVRGGMVENPVEWVQSSYRQGLIATFMDSIYNKPLKASDNVELLKEVADAASEHPYARYWRRLIDYVSICEEGFSGETRKKLRSKDNWFHIAQELIFYVWLEDQWINFQYGYQTQSGNNIDFKIKEPEGLFIEVKHVTTIAERTGWRKFESKIRELYDAKCGCCSLTVNLVGKLDFHSLNRKAKPILESIAEFLEDENANTAEVFSSDKPESRIVIRSSKSLRNHSLTVTGGRDYSAFKKVLIKGIEQKHGQLSKVQERYPIYLGLTLSAEDYWSVTHIVDGILEYYKKNRKVTPLSGIITLLPTMWDTCDRKDHLFIFTPYIFRFQGTKPQISTRIFKSAIQYSVGDAVKKISHGDKGRVAQSSI